MNPNRSLSNFQGAVYQYTYNAKKASGVCLQTITDYSPFGVTLDGRTMQREEYRYGFNTQEKVDEISGRGNHFTAMFWEYDTRNGRRWNQDPKPNASISNYTAFANNPICYADHMGDTIKNMYESAKGNQSKINDLQSQLDKKILKGKERKNVKNEISKLKNQLNKYNKVEELLKQFKAKVGDEEYDKLDRISFNGKIINIEVRIENKPYKINSYPPKLVDEDAYTNVYHFQDKKTEKWLDLNTNKPFEIVLYVPTLKSIANEFGDCLYAVHNPQKQFEQRNMPYPTSGSDQFSFAYQYWVEGIKDKPDINKY